MLRPLPHLRFAWGRTTATTFTLLFWTTVRAHLEDAQNATKEKTSRPLGASKSGLSSASAKREEWLAVKKERKALRWRGKSGISKGFSERKNWHFTLQEKFYSLQNLTVGVKTSKLEFLLIGLIWRTSYIISARFGAHDFRAHAFRAHASMSARNNI